MIILRRFRGSDSVDLQKYQYANMAIEEIKTIVNCRNELEFQGKYFYRRAVPSA